jgi:hypothetical protein
MSNWNNNDREESKPTWLNENERRLTVRTVRGWEKALEGAYMGGTGFSGNNPPLVYTEVLVAMPFDPSVTGATSAFLAPRGATLSNEGQGLTTGSDVPNYRAYFTCPFNGDSATAGGMDGNGVSHGNIIVSGGNAYGVNSYAVSSLGMPRGVTAYIKVCANDANFSNSLNIGLSASVTGCSAFTKGDLLNPNFVPPAVFFEFFGASATDSGTFVYRTDNIAVIRFAGGSGLTTSGATGTQVVSLNVNDGTAGMGGGTAQTRFAVTFNR